MKDHPPAPVPVPVQYRVGDIFEMATLEHGAPRKSDFVKPAPYARETDPGVISRRAEQIDKGKRTLEYADYISAISKEERLPHHPKTPNMRRKYSRRAFDGLIRIWRAKLHVWDKDPEDQEALSTRSRNQSRSESNSGESTSTVSTTDDMKPDIDGIECDEDVKDKTLVKSESPSTSSPCPEVGVKKEFISSWWEDTLEFEEEEYLQLHADDDIDHVKVEDEAE